MIQSENLSFFDMSISDLNEIKDNLISDFDDFWDYNTLKVELTSPTSKYYVIKKGNIIVGFSGIKIIFDQAEIMNIVVKKSERSKGIASYILKNIISLCYTNKINVINLEVNAKNTIAINLYKKYNFNKVGLRKKYYHGTDDAILMSLFLK